MEITWLHLAAVLAAGLVAGYVNTMAGGGSFLTLFALELVGLPAMTANGTNRIAIEIQSILGILGFKSKGMADWRLSLHFAIPALLGAIVGAFVVIDLPDAIFHRVLGVALLFMLAVMILNPKQWLRERHGMGLVRTNSHKAFIVGLYTLAALAMFAAAGHVSLLYGVLMGAGGGLGAWIASRLSVEKGEKVVRPVLMIMLGVMAVRYLGIIPGF